MNSRFQNELGSESGFTLIEVLIAFAILIVMAMGIYQTTTDTFRLRDTLQREGDFYNSIRLSMDILQRDISMIYSPNILLPPKPTPTASPGVGNLPPPPDAKDLAVLGQGDLGQLTTFWLPATDKTGLRLSRFQGSDNKISFIAASHLRIYKDKPESELAKVTYELERQAGSAEIPDGYVLYKVESPNVFEDNERRDKFQQRFPLLYGIKRFKYRYYRKDTDQWESSWDTDKAVKEGFRNFYPDIVEIDLEVAGPQNLTFEGKYDFRPEIPLKGLDPST